jgi:2-polyprenyl-3-methyl-5-hydroxy-6-metoxy-1,4-benzoquinol methylase
MPEDSVVVQSLAYRKNTDAIWRGDAPEKYRRLVPFITGPRVLEIGAAEGVLALLLAEKGLTVTACERRSERHQEALLLQHRWKKLGRKVDGCEMILADITKRPNLFQNIDCFVAVRVMYHLRESARMVVAWAASANVPRIVFCGNKNRALRFEQGKPDEGLGHWNYYSTIKGMSDLLTGAGYKIERIVSEGDPIVIGSHRPSPPA